MPQFNSFSGAMLAFFGKKSGQTTAEFSAELKTLSPEDRAFFTAELAKADYTFELKPPVV